MGRLALKQLSGKEHLIRARKEGLKIGIPPLNLWVSEIMSLLSHRHITSSVALGIVRATALRLRFARCRQQFESAAG